MLFLLFFSLISITRQEIVDTAYLYYIVEWTPGYYNTTFWADTYYVYGGDGYNPWGGYYESHRYCDFEEGNTYNGVAYGFGHWDTWYDFLNSMSGDTIGAGNHSCHYWNYYYATGIVPPPWTTGTDCSGFVSRCWQLSEHHSTSDLQYDGFPVEIEDVDTGDIIDRPGHHVVLVKARLGNIIFYYHAPGGYPHTVTEGDGTVYNFPPSQGWLARTLFETSVEEKELKKFDERSIWYIGREVRINLKRDEVLRVFDSTGREILRLRQPYKGMLFNSSGIYHILVEGKRRRVFHLIFIR